MKEGGWGSRALVRAFGRGILLSTLVKMMDG